MPQLDLNAYLTNFVWFVFVFFVVYIILIKIYIPEIFKTFFYRYAFISSFLLKTKEDRLKLDYYSNIHQFLEPAFSYNIVTKIVEQFEGALVYQRSLALLSVLETLYLESHLELAFQNTEDYSLDLNTQYFTDDPEDE